MKRITIEVSQKVFHPTEVKCHHSLWWAVKSEIWEKGNKSILPIILEPMSTLKTVK